MKYSEQDILNYFGLGSACRDCGGCGSCEVAHHTRTGAVVIKCSFCSFMLAEFVPPYDDILETDSCQVCHEQGAQVACDESGIVISCGSCDHVVAYPWFEIESEDR